jgi:hypothetical protein
MVEIHSSESGLNTSNHRFNILISPQVRLAGCSIIMVLCFFSLPRSLVMFLCSAPLVVLFWILTSISFIFSGEKDEQEAVNSI